MKLSPLVHGHSVVFESAKIIDTNVRKISHLFELSAIASHLVSTISIDSFLNR